MSYRINQIVCAKGSQYIASPRRKLGLDVYGLFRISNQGVEQIAMSMSEAGILRRLEYEVRTVKGINVA